jgi:flagellar biosynthesis protein FlhA
VTSWSKINEFVLPVAIIGCLLVFLVPIPGALLDVLLAANIAIGLVILLTTLHVRTPLEFSVFPTVLLATTLARLVLNVATTRLILMKADTVGLSAAGNVVRQFGQYVSGDRLIVGLVMFTIIFVIQMLVITKGATRISEVAARFALDGIPGRQLAIDADLNAGVIDQSEAQQRRALLTRQADFYGAMDGASKFVRGDAVASVVITLINIVGGLFLGVVQGGMGLANATEVYTKLTIGDGLVSQIPALLISLAAGLLVTRGSESSNLPVEFLRQLFTRPQVLVVAGSFLALLVFSDLPTIPLALLASGCFGLAFVQRGQTRPASTPTHTMNKEVKAKRKRVERAARIEDFLQVEPVELELGLSLVPLANSARGGDLLARITRIRQTVAVDLGLVLPSVRVRDNLALDQQAYRIKIAGNAVAQGTLPVEGAVVLPQSGISSRVLTGGLPVGRPGVDRRARLIPLERVAEAKASGCDVIPPAELISRHLRNVVDEFSHELLTREATHQLIEEAKRTSPTIVAEIIPDVLKLSEVQQVLRGLLREGIPIRPLSVILEALGDHAPHTHDVDELIELVRRRLARTISARYQSSDGCLHVVRLDPSFEKQLASGAGDSTALTPPQSSKFQSILQRSLRRLTTENRLPILLTSSELRVAVRRLARAAVPDIIVLGQDEVASDAQVRSVEIIGLT